MKRMAAVAMIAGIAGMLASAGGCVWQTDYEKAVAAARRANEGLTKCQGALRDSRGEIQKLTQDVQDRDNMLAVKDQQILMLGKGRDDLKADFDKLKALYEKAAHRTGPMALGPILPTVVDKALREFAAANSDLVEYLPQYGMVKLKADLTFEPGSDLVQPGAKEALAKFVTIINSPDAGKFNIYVAGHTDDMPIAKPDTRRRHPDNWYLSVHRAVAVEQVLVKAGLAPERIGAMGFGEYHPIEPNKPGHKGNQANRRVDIWVDPPDRFLTSEAGSSAAPAPAAAPAGEPAGS